MSDSAKQVMQLLEASLSSDNAIRKQAEAQLTQAANQDAQTFMNAILECFASDVFDEEQKRYALIHYKGQLRDYFMGRANNMWIKLSAEHKSIVKDTLIKLVISQDTAGGVRRACIPLIGDMASIMLGDDEKAEGWEQLVPALIQNIDNPGPAVESLVALLNELVPYIREQIAAEAAGFVAIIQRLITGAHDMDVKTEVLKLVCNIALQTAENRACWPAFQHLITGMFAFLQKTASGCMIDDNGQWKQYTEDDEEEFDDAVQHAFDLVESIIEVADTASAFFKPHIKDVTDTLFTIVRDDSIEEDIRKFCGEIILSILNDKPKMCKQVEGFNTTMIETSILLMITVTEEEVADRDVSSEPLFSLGERGVDHIVKAMGGQEMFPILFGYVKTLIESPDWQKRYAGISCICQTTEYIPITDREMTLKDLIPVVVRALQDECWMIRLAACSCVGQMAYDLPPVFQVHHTQEIIESLIHRFDDDYPEVTQKALRAYTNFCDELTGADIEPYMPELLKRFHRLVSLPFSDPKKAKDIAAVRENAITAISVTASVAEKKFIPYYADIAPLVLQTLKEFDESSEHAEYLRDVRAQAVDCISHIGLAVGKDTFANDGVVVMQLLLELRNSQIRDDDPVIEYLYEAFKRMVYAMEENFAQFIEPLMKYYLRVLMSRGEEVDDYTDVPNYMDYSFHAGEDGFQAIKTSVIIEIIQALSLINTMIDQCGDAFIPALKPTLEAVVPLIKYSLVHEAVASVLQVLASCLKPMNKMVENGQLAKGEITQLLEVIVVDSFNLLGDDQYIKELIDNANFLCTVADGVASCLINAGKDTLPDNLVTMISNKTFNILSISTEERNKHLLLLNEPGIDEEDVEKIMEQAQMQQGFRSSLLSLLGGTMSSHPSSYMRISANMTVDFVTRFLRSDNEQDLCLGLFLCCDILQYLGEAGHVMWPQFINELIASISNPKAGVRQGAVYGIVWAARQSAFNEAMVKACIPKLAECIRMNDANDDEVQLATDNAIAAVNVLLLFKGDMMTESESTELSAEMFRNYPLIVDTKENISMSELIFDGIAQNNKHIIGYQQQNLSKIIGSFGKMYKTLFSEDELDKRIAEFLKSLGPGLQSQLGLIAPDQQKYVERMIKDL